MLTVSIRRMQLRIICLALFSVLFMGVTFGSPDTLIVDIGNTMTKVAIKGNSTKTQIKSFVTKDLTSKSELLSWVSQEFGALSAINGIAISSVVPSQNAVWAEVADSLGAPHFFLNANSTTHIIFQTGTPPRAGGRPYCGSNWRG